jgi:hypothetical protein
LLRLAAVLGLALAVITAQPAPGQEASDRLLQSFYKDPKPERLVRFFERFEAVPVPRRWEAYPPLAGFFAVVFRTHPDRIDTLVPARLSPKSADTIAAALQLADQQPAIARLQARFAEAGSDERLKREFANLPARLEDLRVGRPTHLDILWGAAYASGDGRFVRIIVDFMAQIANRSERIALDVAQTALALSGGPREILGELRGRHGDTLAVEIVFAATALWALQSNARQHSFVERVIAGYVAENSGSFASKALWALTPRR